MTQIAQLMLDLAKGDGFSSTNLPGVNIFMASQPSSREPLCYEQGLVFVGQGAKRVFSGGEIFEYNESNYLSLTVPIPAECETHVKNGSPMIAMTVDLDVTVLSNIIDQLENHFQAELLEKNVKSKGLYISPRPPEVNDILIRLLKALASPVETKIIGKQIIRELYFRILLGENGANLLALTMKNTDLARVEKALKRIHSEYDKPIDVNSLASMVNMSVSTFHRTFKEVTLTSPIQYLKKIRLTRAKSLLVEKGSRVSEAAIEVGYESSTQFSREFKRYFGKSPVEFCK